MKAFLQIVAAMSLVAIAVACAAIAAAAMVARDVMLQLPERVDAVIEREAERTREELRAMGVGVCSAMEAESDKWRAAVMQEIRATRRELVEEIRVTARETIPAASAPAVSAITELSERAAGAIDEYGKTAATTTRMIELLTPQVLGATAAAKVTAGEVATAARTWRRETPAIAENVREATANVRKATRLSTWQKAMLLIGAAAAAIAAAK